MKIKIETTLLRAALRVVSVAAATRSTLPILSHVKIEAKAGQLTLYATDLDLFVTETVIAETPKEGETTAPLQLLAQLCERIQASMVELESVGTTLLVRGGDVSAVLETLPADEFPPHPKQEGGKRIGCDASELLTPFQMLAQAMSRDSMDYTLMGVNIAPSKLGTTFAATNRKKLAIFQGESNLTDTDVIAPDVFVKALLKIQPKGAATMSINGGAIDFASNGTRITAKLIEGKYPNWRRFVPDTGDNVFSCGRKNLSEAITTCALLTSPELPGVRLTGKGKELEIESVREGKRAKATVLGTELVGQPDISVQFNARHMLETLGVMEGEDVRIICTDAKAPMLIQEGKFKAVLNTIRTAE